jgi:hypothetical protein
MKMKMKKKIKMKMISAGSLTLLLSLFANSPSTFAGVLGYHSSLSFHEDFNSLKKALIVTIPEVDNRNTPQPPLLVESDKIVRQIKAEIDQELMKEMGAVAFNSLKTDIPALEQARIKKMNQLVSQNRYNISLPNANSVYDGEVWYRRENNTQQMLVDGLKLAQLPKVGDVMEYNLNAAEVPYGGYFFPDNLGGITMRWQRGIINGLIEYRTFFEKAWQELKEDTKNVTHGVLTKSQFEHIKSYCPAFNDAKTKFLELKQEIDDSDEEDDIPLIAEYEDLKKDYPQVENLVALNFQLKEEFHNTDCYMLKNYSTMKAKAEEKVKNVLRSFPHDEFETLSATEKYDIMMGYYDFRTTAFEKEYKGKRRFKATRKNPLLSTFVFNRYWEGRCNADRAAGICRRYWEPTQNVSVAIPELNRRINFQPLDAKALLMSTYFYLEEGKYAQLGVRTVRVFPNPQEPNPNPAAIELALRVLFMKYKIPFVIDNHNDHTVNNVTVIGFKRTVTNVQRLDSNDKAELVKKVKETLNNSETPIVDFKVEKGENSFENPRSFYSKALNATWKVSIEVRLKLLSELKPDKANSPTKAKIAAEKAATGDYTKKEYITYDIYLNDKNEIVEGDYIGGGMDFMWFTAGKGNQEQAGDGATFIKFDVVKDLATQSATKGGSMARPHLK